MQILYEPVAVRHERSCLSIQMPQSGENHWGDLRRWTSNNAKSKYPSIELLHIIKLREPAIEGNTIKRRLRI